MPKLETGARSLRERFWNLMDQVRECDPRLYRRLYSAMEEIQDEYYRERLFPMDTPWFPRNQLTTRKSGRKSRARRGGRRP